MNVEYLRADYILNNLFSHFSVINLNGLNFSGLLFFVLAIGIIAVIIFGLRLFLLYNKQLKEKPVFLELTPPFRTEQDAYTTEKLFSLIHALTNKRTFIDRLLGNKTRVSLEIVSTKNQGIRYLLRTTKSQANTLRRSLLSYLPQLTVKADEDYLPERIEDLKNRKYEVVEFKLSHHFAFPLNKQTDLAKHDPIAYITGMMTKLDPTELISLQLLLATSKPTETKKISNIIFYNSDVLDHLNSKNIPTYLKAPVSILRLALSLLFTITMLPFWVISTLATNEITPIPHFLGNKPKGDRIRTSFENELVESINSKINQPLFEATIRVLVIVKNSQNLEERVSGFASSFATFANHGHQSIVVKKNPGFIKKLIYLSFKKRLFAISTKSHISVSEASDIYHFPYTSITNTENLVKSRSKSLAAPLSLKKGNKYDVVFGKNDYGGTITDIGLTEEERETHMYIIGRTGSGKTTMMFSMAKHDIEQGRGMAFLDPHGDAADDLISIIPEDRLNDLVFINPIDLKYPIGINLLELTPGLDEDEAELEKEVVAEGVISLFRKVFSKEENINAHRIEYILRNAIYTSFTIPDRTIFTVYDLLNNPPFQKDVVSKLTDENLKNFWKFEFGRAGDYQVVKMVGGVTAKIGRFLFSPTAKRILEQPKSTIDFSEIIDSGKIVICNLSQGKLGEDTSRLLGTTIMTKIQQASLKRATTPESKRTPFYLYVDEFQNFATHSFTKMLSEGRKYKLRVTIAEQSTSQQDDRNIVNVILANVTTVVCFRSANYIDEELMLNQFAPSVGRGEIANLPRYRFYIKVSALDPEDPFSGETIYIPVEKDSNKTERLIEASRKNWAIAYEKPKVSVIQKSTGDNKQPDLVVAQQMLNSNGLPAKKSS